MSSIQRMIVAVLVSLLVLACAVSAAVGHGSNLGGRWTTSAPPSSII
jgi:hypothetical protein